MLEDTDLQDLQKEAQGLNITNDREEEEQQKAANLIALKTLKQEGDTKVLGDNDLQDLQEEAQGMTTTNTREEQQQKAANLTTLKTLEQEGDIRCRRITTCRTCRRRPPTPTQRRTRSLC